MLTVSSHYISLVGLTVHLSVVAIVVVASHYYGRGYGEALGKLFLLCTFGFNIDNFMQLCKYLCVYVFV